MTQLQRSKTNPIQSNKAVSGDVVFENVQFHYEDGQPVLHDFNLKVRRGETIALVGPTGGGKSTIVNLLCRFYEPKEGRIFIKGIDYTKLKIQSIQSRIGVVLQTPHLFTGTIRENLRYGRLDASDNDIEQASRLAGAHDFIVKLEQSYDTDVGEGSNLLSTGQKQLISHVLVLYWMHRAAEAEPVRMRRLLQGREDMPEVGIFAQRARHRPNPVGVTAVELLRREKNRLVVRGLDAINGTPVVDVKPYVPKFDSIDSPRVPAWMNQLMERYF